MKSSIARFCAVLCLAPAPMNQAHSEPLRSPSASAPGLCAAAARSVHDWGWGDGDDARAPISSIVSAVNNRLRINSGRLPAEDIARLKKNASSDDACIREFSAEILRMQDGGAARTGPARLAVADARKSVTRRSEKQSAVGEAISP